MRKSSAHTNALPLSPESRGAGGTLAGKGDGRSGDPSKSNTRGRGTPEDREQEALIGLSQAAAQDIAARNRGYNRNLQEKPTAGTYEDQGYYDGDGRPGSRSKTNLNQKNAREPSYDSYDHPHKTPPKSHQRSDRQLESNIGIEVRIHSNNMAPPSTG